MRWLAPTVLLALLAACTVTTTGAPCSSDLNCPTSQGCGSDRLCSTAALSCPGHGTDGECTPGRSCVAGQLVTCTAAGGVCSTGPVATTCPTHQQCASSGGAASCECFPTRCGTSTSSFCNAGGQLVFCAQDLSSAKACWYEASSAACSDPGASCVESGGGAACTCPTVNACTTLDASQCSPGGGQVLRCKPVVSGSACLTWQTETECSDPGTTCTDTGSGAACTCPTADACAPLDATTCSATGNQVLRCQPVVSGSACLTWQAGTDCATSSLVCSAGACACPANPGPVFHADSAGGSEAGAIPAPTGAAAPPQCRFRSLAVALASANVFGPGATAKAAGWSAPGGVMLFTEPGALSIGAGVTLTTDDASTTTHYAMTTAAPLAGPFLSIGPGGSLSGFEIRNDASSGAGVQTACPAPANTASVSVSTVRIAAASGATPVVRFGSGVHVTGSCPATMANLTVDGAATGILVESAPPVESTATAVHVTGSTVVGVSVVEGGRISFTGGLVDFNAKGVSIGATGAGAPSFSAIGTTFSSNTGDAIYVGRGTLFSDGCPYVNNGTHVHVEQDSGVTLSVVVRNSRGPAKMTGASNSAFRLLGKGIAASSTVSIVGNEITGNGASELYLLGTSNRRGGGLVFTFPMPSSVVFEGNTVASNLGDQVLVAASAGSVDLRGGIACEVASNNAFGCYDTGAVGIYSNGAAVQIDRNHWTQQPAGPSVDYAGVGITGASSVCTPSAQVCQ